MTTLTVCVCVSRVACVRVRLCVQFDLAIPLLVAVFFTTINILFVGFVMVESKGEEKKPWEWRRLNPLRSFYMLLESRLALGVGASQTLQAVELSLT